METLKMGVYHNDHFILSVGSQGEICIVPKGVKCTIEMSVRQRLFHEEEKELQIRCTEGFMRQYMYGKGSDMFIAREYKLDG